MQPCLDYGKRRAAAAVTPDRRTARRAGSRVFLAAMRTLVLLVSLGGCGYLPNTTTVATTVPSTALPTAVADLATPRSSVESPARQSAPEGALSIREVARLTKPAIVQVTNQQVVLDQFKRPVPQTQGVGSGVIYDPSGLILTNNHVIDGARALLVSLPDGRTYPGKLLGGDPQMDLAVVKIDPKAGESLPVAKLGDSSALDIGDWVVAIGNALALPGGPTVTAGVVSALGRAVQEPGDGDAPGPYLYDLVQTDAAINPGNSGGALVNSTGEVIGINTLGAGSSPDGASAQGISFAISINAAKPIADELATKGKATHAYIGVSLVALNPALVSQPNPQTKDGLIVRQVGAGSPAAKAGLRVMDVIVEIDGQRVSGETDLGRSLARRKPGDTIKLTVVRGAEQKMLEIWLGELPGR